MVSASLLNILRLQAKYLATVELTSALHPTTLNMDDNSENAPALQPS